MKIQWFSLAAAGWLVAGIGAAAFLGGCGKSSGGSLATVNGDPITMDEFVEYLKTKDRVRVVANNGQVAEARVADTLAFQALQDLVTRKVVHQLAVDEGVAADAKAVREEIEFRKQLNPNFVPQYTAAGFTLDRIKDQIQVDLDTERLLTKGITVSDAELDALIKDNRLDVTPATADLSWVFVRTQAKRDEVDNELKSGQSFSTVARRLSDASSASDQGARYPIRIVAQMPANLQTAVKATQEGQATDWIKGDGGYGKFYVEKKVGEKKEVLSKAKREYFRRELAKSQGAKAKDIGKRLADYLFGSKVLVEPKDLKSIWDKTIEKAKKERKIEVPSATGDTSQGK